ncbi:hypothetical protein U9M48_013804 [Paspalum notatum var. saurae]|uniref:Uncharacterized protein n=1 Tax=Paspalum notatum var. saurae TaxID=547442 RepID=A0AAQ3T1G3_PASNO
MSWMTTNPTANGTTEGCCATLKDAYGDEHEDLPSAIYTLISGRLRPIIRRHPTALPLASSPTSSSRTPSPSPMAPPLHHHGSPWAPPLSFAPPSSSSQPPSFSCSLAMAPSFPLPLAFSPEHRKQASVVLLSTRSGSTFLAPPPCSFPVIHLPKREQQAASPREQAATRGRGVAGHGSARPPGPLHPSCSLVGGARVQAPWRRSRAPPRSSRSAVPILFGRQPPRLPLKLSTAPEALLPVAAEHQHRHPLGVRPNAWLACSSIATSPPCLS